MRCVRTVGVTAAEASAASAAAAVLTAVIPTTLEMSLTIVWEITVYGIYLHFYKILKFISLVIHSN